MSILILTFLTLLTQILCAYMVHLERKKQTFATMLIIDELLETATLRLLKTFDTSLSSSEILEKMRETFGASLIMIVGPAKAMDQLLLRMINNKYIIEENGCYKITIIGDRRLDKLCSSSEILKTS